MNLTEKIYIIICMSLQGPHKKTKYKKGGIIMRKLMRKFNRKYDMLCTA